MPVPMTGVSSLSFVSTKPRPLGPSQKHSESTLASQNTSNRSTLKHQNSSLSNNLTRVSSAGSSTENGSEGSCRPDVTCTSPRPSNGSGSGVSGRTATPANPSGANSAMMAAAAAAVSSSSSPPSFPDPNLAGETPGDFTHFVERFHKTITQIESETSVGLDFAHRQVGSGGGGGGVGADDDDDSYPDYDDLHLHSGHAHEDARALAEELHYHNRPLPPVLGYDEFGRPYRPEEPVRFLNAIIRRMPTIESMGSREWGGSGWGSASYRSSLQRDGMGGAASIRSTPTGLGLGLSEQQQQQQQESEPSSRRTSARTSAELLGDVNGGLGGLVIVNSRRASGGSGRSIEYALNSVMMNANGNGNGGNISPGWITPSTVGAMSRSTVSYHTAYTSSSSASLPSPSRGGSMDHGGYSLAASNFSVSPSSSQGPTRTPTEESAS